MSLKEERKYLAGFLKKVRKRKAIKLLAFYNNELIGVSDIAMGEKKSDSHIGTLGITVKKEFRNQGIGKLLMKLILKTAQKELKGMKILELTVFGNNPIARKMYQKFGFKEFGLLPKGLFLRHKYVDHIYMYKNLRSNN